MNPEEVDKLLFRGKPEETGPAKDTQMSLSLEQYKTYLKIFDGTSNRSQKSNEFFLGLNAAIIALLGYVETKSLPHANVVFMLVPFVGISICYSWYRMINSYSQLNRAKFKVIHRIEQRLPLALFETEWHALGRGRDPKKYVAFSKIERNIPLTFIALYALILLITLL